MLQNKCETYSFLLFFMVPSIFTMEKTSVLLSPKIAIEEYLIKQLADPAIAKEVATIVTENILRWQAPTIAPNQITTIIAYAFGNRILPNGNRMPGPMNETLADLVVELYRETNATIYAQWEIAEAIGHRISPDKIIVIYPTLDVQANTVYLSTAGVASAIVKQCCDPQKLGKVAVVAFNDHLYRCLQLSREAGMDAYAPYGYAMPSHYDVHSGQPWTRNRLTYLVTDIKARVTNHLEKMLSKTNFN